VAAKPKLPAKSNFASSQGQMKLLETLPDLRVELKQYQFSVTLYRAGD
jgi:hypothetical protein